MNAVHTVPESCQVGCKVKVLISRVVDQQIVRSVEEVTINHVHDYFNGKKRKPAWIIGVTTYDGLDQGPFGPNEFV